MELNNNYASNGKANAGVALGVVGTALGALNTFGNVGNFAMGANAYNKCGRSTNGHDACVDRHELEMVMNYERQLMDKNLDISELQSEKISDQKDIEVYKQIKVEMNAMKAQLDSQIAAINGQLGAQAVQNQANKDSFQILQERMDTNVSTLSGAIDREVQTRKANDNLIVTYANTTFTPKTVVTTAYAGGTMSPSSSPQQTYNPLPSCDCNC